VIFNLQISLKRFFIAAFFLLPPIFIYIYFAQQLNFIQDDAYISYRYVANFLNGDGLVFNLGERVEGFTNFGWVVYLILWGAFHFSYILISKLTGIVFGAGLIVVTYLAARRVFPSEDRWFTLLPSYLLGFNVALAYWSQSGLETAAFAFFVGLSFYLFLVRSRWLIFSLTLAAWLRPEGALLVIFLIIIEAIVEKRFPKFSFSCASFAFVLSLPFILFKYFYYGSILPNPFYAKTSWSVEQLKAGLDYAAIFFRHYGFYGAGFVIPAIFWKRLSTPIRSVWLFAFFYVTYVVLVGGDVLKVHRFIVPIFGLSAILITASLRLALNKFSPKTRLLFLFIASIPLMSFTYLLPKGFVNFYHDRELELTNSMQLLARDIKSTDSTNFSVALTTIGAFSYELIGHTVIDMLGLTDSMIARHPEAPIHVFETTWREQNFNATYVLTREPNYIVFSTGVKPSAPAEQALLLYTQFLESYVSLPWFHKDPEDSSSGTLDEAFKKIHNLRGKISPTYPPEFVRLFKEGCELGSANKHFGAIAVFDSAIAISPNPRYYDLLLEKGLSHRALRQRDTSVALFNLILKQDSMVFDAHKLLYINSIETGDSAMAHFHKAWIQKLAPWIWPRLEYEVQMAIRRGKTS